MSIALKSGRNYTSIQREHAHHPRRHSAAVRCRPASRLYQRLCPWHWQWLGARRDTRWQYPRRMECRRHCRQATRHFHTPAIHHTAHWHVNWQRYWRCRHFAHAANWFCPGAIPAGRRYPRLLSGLRLEWVKLTIRENRTGFYLQASVRAEPCSDG